VGTRWLSSLSQLAAPFTSTVPGMEQVSSFPVSLSGVILPALLSEALVFVHLIMLVLF